MILQTYQSRLVKEILAAGREYRAKPNLSLRGEYAALIDLLGLRCECPIFAVVKGRKQNTGGKVSGSYQMTLEVPDREVRLTEYGEWADFLYAFQFTMPGNYKALRPDCEELSVRRFNELMEHLRAQKKPSQYETPQAVLERIDPQWVRKIRKMRQAGPIGRLLQRLRE